MSDTKEMKITALASWYGSNRMLASEVGKALKGCEWVGIVFAGGMSEVPHIDARTLLVNDKHLHVINLAMVVADCDLRPKLIEAVDALAFHPDALLKAQAKCKVAEHEHWRSSHGNLEWAINYFVASWMGRSAKAGTDQEFDGGLPLRWNAGGGDSNTRYRSAIESIGAWGKTMRRCNFSTLDFREFLGKCKDAPRHGIYADAPFPDDGDGYKHKFKERDHIDLRTLLAQFTETRVVIRYHDHPLIRDLYPDEGHWHWNRLAGRNQANDETPEVLITNFRL